MKPKHILIILLFLLLTAYSLYQARFLILGPQVWITSHLDGETAASSIITISGQARNAAWLSLNGRQIFTDERGFWEETVAVSEGASIMTVKVRDRFGREKIKHVRIIF